MLTSTSSVHHALSSGRSEGSLSQSICFSRRACLAGMTLHQWALLTSFKSNGRATHDTIASAGSTRSHAPAHGQLEAVWLGTTNRGVVLHSQARLSSGDLSAESSRVAREQMMSHSLAALLRRRCVLLVTQYDPDLYGRAA